MFVLLVDRQFGKRYQQLVLPTPRAFVSLGLLRTLMGDVAAECCTLSLAKSDNPLERLSLLPVNSL